MARFATRIAVIGVGNEFRRDDGVGPAVARRLQERAVRRPFPPGTAVSTCDGDPGRLIALWEGADLAVVVDAAYATVTRPGRTHRMEVAAHELRRAGTTSSHGLGLGEAVELARVLDRLPGRLVVIAVEGADHTLGTGLSPEVSGVVDPLAERVEEEIARHRDAAARGVRPPA